MGGRIVNGHLGNDDVRQRRRDGVDDALASAETGEIHHANRSRTGVVGSESAVAQTGLTKDGCALVLRLLNYMNYQWLPWVQHLELPDGEWVLGKASFYTSVFDSVVSALYSGLSIRSGLMLCIKRIVSEPGFRWSLITPQY